MNDNPIGVFDSGVGGLTVVKELIKSLPYENIVYLGDTARVPYGTKSSETIKRFSIENAAFLKKFKVKLIIVACNTASSVALPILRKRFSVPVIGVIGPGAMKAVATTRNNRIGVIGTPATIKSNAYEKEIKRFSSGKKVFSVACPLFVPIAEEGSLSSRITIDVVSMYLKPLMKKNIDTLVLGCTHYPLLRNAITKVVGKNVRIIDSAVSVAEEVAVMLEGRDVLRISLKKPDYRFFATDTVEQFVKTGEKFLKRKIKRIRRVNYV